MIEEDLRSLVEDLANKTVVIIGVGNTLKGDDGAGPIVCSRLKSGNRNAKVIDTGTVPENYLQPVLDMSPDCVIIIDAVAFGEVPGTVRLLDPGEIAEMTLSTHSLSLQIFANIIRDEIGAKIIFLGIQPASIRLGAQVSPDVEKAIDFVTSAFADFNWKESD